MDTVEPSDVDQVGGEPIDEDPQSTDIFSASQMEVLNEIWDNSSQFGKYINISDVNCAMSSSFRCHY